MSTPPSPLPNVPLAAPRPVGRPVTLSVTPATVMLEPAMITWGKQQEGGLSATLRRLLHRAMETEKVPGEEAQTRADSP